ncbi:hypothetical protein TNCV_1267151 [Trichonephila clavipes]|nr:hypothetical protein TNCV_1267151 [Trichonephila clavipes]
MRSLADVLMIIGFLFLHRPIVSEWFLMIPPNVYKVKKGVELILMTLLINYHYALAEMEADSPVGPTCFSEAYYMLPFNSRQLSILAVGYVSEASPITIPSIKVDIFVLIIL